MTGLVGAVVRYLRSDPFPASLFSKIPEYLMPVYLVTYDLNKETKRPNITGKIKEYGYWAKLSESSYAIKTEQTPQQVYNVLQPLLDSNDTLYVITLKRPHYGQGSKEVNQWLENNLPY
jgi:hypothetical protein